MQVETAPTFSVRGRSKMSYRYDPDLEFLKDCANDDLDILVTYLIGPEDNRRLTEDLSLTDEFRQHHPDHQKYWSLIAAELQLFGGNTLANVLRGGEGVVYKEVLCDVCDKMEVNYNKNASTQ